MAMAPGETPEVQPMRSRSRSALSRRAFVRRAAVTGAGTAAFVSMPSLADAAAGTRSTITNRQAADPNTLVIALDGTPTTLDPHEAYDYRSVLTILGAYEGLVG